MIYDWNLAAVKACIIASLYPFIFLIPDKRIRLCITIALSPLSIYLKSSTLFFVILGVYLYGTFRNLKFLSKIISVLIAITAVFILCYTKLNSIIGRLLIYKVILSNFDSIPIGGFGKDTFKFQYAAWQANYFKLHKSQIYQYVAQAPSYAYNEFMNIYIEQGLPAALCLLLSVVFNFYILFRHRKSLQKVLALSNTTIIAFSSISYSLHSIWILLLFLCTNLAILINAFRLPRSLNSASLVCTIYTFIIWNKYNVNVNTWNDAVSLPVNANTDKEALFKNAFQALNHNQYFLRDYCNFLLNEQKYYTVLRLASTNRIYFNQYERSMTAGDAYFKINKLDSAVSNYSQSHYIIPVRIMPLYKLMNVYLKSNNKGKALMYARLIRTTPVKIPSKLTDKLKAQAENVIKSYAE